MSTDILSPHPYADKFPMLPEIGAVLTGMSADRQHYVTIRRSRDYPDAFNVSVIDLRASRAMETNRPMTGEGVAWIVHKETRGAEMDWSTETETATRCPVSPKREVSKPSVYFVQDEDGFIKIGYSENVKKRLAHLQTSSRQKLSLIGSVNGDKNLESLFHRVFRDERVRGEWFRPSKRLLSFIEEELANAY